MAAAYDQYDYPSYWIGRDYEHESEVLAIKRLLGNVKKIDKILEIGTGFGRLFPYYRYRAKSIILTDPSAKLLKLARDSIDEKNVKFIQTSCENIGNKVRSGTVDLIFVVRVLHHIKDYDDSFKKLNKLLKNKGYLILEFPNRAHFKSVISEFIKGDYTYAYEIFPKDLSSKRSIKAKKLPFINYHPDDIVASLEKSGFEVKNKVSVSNFRSPLLKKFIPTSALIGLDKLFQKPLSLINFGPSIFLLAQKKDNLA